MTAMDEDSERRRTVRARNRALGLVLVALAALFYAVAIVKMTG